jgi:isoleucyl-tRNA synthetase
MHGHALDEDGRKMSKSVGNVIQPDEAIERHGRDAMRLFLLSFTGQGEDMRFSWEEMANRARQLNILWNVFRFPLPYMRMDGFDPDAVTLGDLEDDLETVDRWILSRLQTVEATMTEHFEDYEQDVALETLLEFVVEDLSRFYVQAVRDRVWEEGDSASKTAAYATLYRVLRETVALLAPFAPFVTEAIYGHLTREDSHPTVHMCDWPEADDAWRDEHLETDVSILRAIEQAGGAARQQAGRSRRWPVPRIVVDAPTDRVAEAVETHADLLAERLNARRVEVVGPAQEWDELTYAAEADMSELGPAFGDDAGRVVGALNEAGVEEWSMAALEAAVADATGLEVEIEESMVEPVRSVPDETAQETFDAPVGEGDETITGRVYVDASLTDAVESEGYAREVIRRAQELRKELELDMDERVRLDVTIDDERVAGLVAERAGLIDEEVRVAERGDVEGGRRETYEVEGVEVTIALAPVAGATA